MTARQMIEQAVAAGDWQLLCEGLMTFAGLKLTPPTLPGSVRAEPLAGSVGGAEREALAWYADRSNYELRGGPIPVLMDEGERARAVLGDSPPPAPPKRGRGRPRKNQDGPAGGVAGKPPVKGRKVLEAVANSGRQAAARQPKVSVTPRAEPPNRFKDDLTEARADLKSTRWINANIVPAQRRDPWDDPEVDIACDGCSNSFKCRASEVRRKKPGAEASGGDFATENYCPRCLTGAARKPT